MAFKNKKLDAIVLTLKRVFGIKDYKYKNEVIKDDWEEILKGNDYY